MTNLNTNIEFPLKDISPQQIQTSDDVKKFYEQTEKAISFVEKKISNIEDNSIQMKFIQIEENPDDPTIGPAYGNEKPGMGWFILESK